MHLSYRIYYIKEFADPKARNYFQAQIETIFEQKGFSPISYPQANYISRLFFLKKKIKEMPEEGIVFFIHPLYSKTNRILLDLLLYNHKKVVCIVSDINTLRFGGSLNKEIGYWKKLRYFIFQNEKMEKFALKMFGRKTSVNIELFDLLFETRTLSRQKSKTIVFSGNINKCAFVNELYRIEGLLWNIYSSDPIVNRVNIQYIPLKDEINDRPVLDGAFGLVWEGSSIEDISSTPARYLEMVSPLKLSNYLLNGLPVIIHENAAMANFVKENEIGFCVSSLYDIERKINAMEVGEYERMQNNALKLGLDISTGFFTNRAIDNILELIRNDGN